MAGRLLTLQDAAKLRSKIADKFNFGANSNIEREWWYLSGFFWDTGDEENLSDGNKYIPEIGIHVAFFHLQKGDIQSLITHASITDTKQKKYIHEANSIQFPSLKARGVISVDTLEIKLNRWTLIERTRKKWLLSFQAEERKIDLTLTVPDALWLHGDNGVYRRKDGYATFYYSIPFIEAKGEVLDLRRGGKKKISGSLWYDHEIGPKVENNSWKWFSLRFTDGTVYMLYFFADKKTQSLFEKFSQKESKGVFLSTTLSHIEVHSKKKTKLKSGNTYSTMFEIAYTDDATGKTGVFIVDSVMSEQEFYVQDNESTVGYWEGIVKCTKIEEGKRVEGFGYVEDKPLW